MATEVLVIDHQASWPVQFAAAAACVRAAFGAAPVVVEHIGSTAVPGLCAKPVIDILLGADDLATARARRNDLAAFGYRYRPEYETELPERRYFVRDAEAERPRVHLHAVVRGGELWRHHLAFRDALLADPSLAHEYAALKRRLAAAHAHDKAAYTEAKGPFITRVLSIGAPPASGGPTGKAPAPHRSSWQRAWQGLGAAGEGKALHAQLLARYAEPHRAYHTLQHLGECLAAFETVRALAPNPAEVEMALWFHDAIYDVHRHDNEERSALWARDALRAGGVAASRAERVAELVRATRHTAPAVGDDAGLLIDIDLGILGADEARFTEYERQIRSEYAFVPEPQFSRRRRDILQSFLDRVALYSTAHFRAEREAQARRNLARALASLPPG